MFIGCFFLVKISRKQNKVNEFFINNLNRSVEITGTEKFLFKGAIHGFLCKIGGHVRPDVGNGFYLADIKISITPKEIKVGVSDIRKITQDMKMNSTPFLVFNNGYIGNFFPIEIFEPLTEKFKFIIGDFMVSDVFCKSEGQEFIQ